MNKWKVLKNEYYRLYDNEAKHYIDDWLHLSSIPPQKWLSKNCLRLIKEGRLSLVYKDDYECPECGSAGWQLEYARYCPMCGAYLNDGEEA